MGDVIEVTFVSVVDWMMSKSPYWFKVEKIINGETKEDEKFEKGIYTIKFDIEPYLNKEGEEDPRRATIKFINTSNKSDIASFDISQKRADIEVSGVTIDEGKGEIDFDWYEQYEQNDSNSFQVKSSVEYKISIEGDSDKINVYHVDNSVRYGGAAKDTVNKFTVTPVDYNLSKKEYTATITITPIRFRFDDDGNLEIEKISDETLKKTITVSQDNQIFAIIETADVQETEKKLNGDNNIAIPTALSGFSELDYNYLEDSEDRQSASKSIVVALQDGADIKIKVDKDTDGDYDNDELKVNVTLEASSSSN